MLKLVANNLFRDSYIKSLKFESDTHRVIIFYEGDYEGDKAQGRCNASALTLSCRLNGEGFDVILAQDHIFITLPYVPTLSVKDIDEFKMQLDVAQDVAEELRTIIKEYFDIDIK